jgi:gliding motility associated protien GldN
MKIIKLTLILCFAFTALFAQDTNSGGSKKAKKTVTAKPDPKPLVDLTKYWISVDGVDIEGPFSLEELTKKAKEGTLKSSYWVVKTGGKEWQNANAYPELKSAIEAETPRIQQEVYLPPPLPIDKKLSDTTFSDGVQAIQETKKRSFEPYALVRPQDVLYSKRLWRNIDFREKLNQSFTAKESNIVNIVYRLVKNGDIVAFQDDKFLTKYSVADALARFKEDKGSTPEDTAKIKGADGKMIAQDKSIQANVDLSTVVGGIQIKEDWIFDKIRQELEPRIVGMAFYMKSKAEVESNRQKLLQSKVGGTTNNAKAKQDSIPTSQKIVFWVNFDQIRKYLHKEIVINNYNDASPLSFDDLLVKRIFASYIVKESNINGTDIKNSLINPTLQDRLRESERIKKALMDWEHDLWSY